MIINRDLRKRLHEERGQAFQDDWPLRILRCPLHRCRRTEHCTLRLPACAAIKQYPFPEAILKTRRQVFRLAIEERYEAIEAGPEAKAALSEESRRNTKRRRETALARARAKLGLRKGGRG